MNRPKIAKYSSIGFFATFIILTFYNINVSSKIDSNSIVNELNRTQKILEATVEYNSNLDEYNIPSLAAIKANLDNICSVSPDEGCADRFKISEASSAKHNLVYLTTQVKNNKYQVAGIQQESKAKNNATLGGIICLALFMVSGLFSFLPSNPNNPNPLFNHNASA